jgi:hypothetical protein
VEPPAGDVGGSYSARVTGEQIAVVVLLALAFAAGWYVRGEGPARKEASGDGPDLVALLDSAGDVLWRVLTASRATVAMWRIDGAADGDAVAGAVQILSSELNGLRDVAGTLGRQLGSAHPLTVELGLAVEAATLVESEFDHSLEGGCGQGLEACLEALIDARTRYVRGCEPLRALLRHRRSLA